MADTDDDYAQAKGLVLSHQRASISWLQRQLRVGYNVAAKHIERMEAEGIVSAPDHVGFRTVLEQTHPTLEKLAQQLADHGATVQTDAATGRLQIHIPVGSMSSARFDASATDDRLRLLIERIERLEEEKKGLSDDIKDVYAEAKAVGYDPKAMRLVVRLRKMRPDDRREMEAIVDTYKNALGLE